MNEVNGDNLRRLVRRKSLVHGIAECKVCAWRCEDYLTVQRKAADHARHKGHVVIVELGYAMWITPNAEGESRAASARTLHPLVVHSSSEGGRE